MVRDVQPEILDRLPENHPDALVNRRDMRRLNGLMGNFRWIERRLADWAPPPRTRIVELAAGDGSFGAFLHRRQTTAQEWDYTGVDFWERPLSWPESWNWEQGDVRTAQALIDAEVVIANHILHQFEDSDLRTLGDRIMATARQIIINEPCRRRLHLWQARCTFLLGMNYVSRHDALTSVRAGFSGEELPALLGLDRREWQWSVNRTWRGGYRLIARRAPEVR